MQRGVTVKKVSIVLFQLGILFITLIILLIAGFILPVVARDFAMDTPEWAYLQYPLLIAIYVTLIPFLVAIFQAFKLSRLIQVNQIFSIEAVGNLKIIKVSGFIIAFLYLSGTFVISNLVELSPGIAMLGVIILLSSSMIALIAGILEELLKKALEIKEENDLTV